MHPAPSFDWRNMQYSLLAFLLITSFLSINLHSSVFAADTAAYTDCSKSITCGSVESNISYPFWGQNRAEYCRKSEFVVTCDGTVPVFTMEKITFRLLGMNTSSGAGTPTVKVPRQDYWGDICPSEYIGTNLNFSLFDYASGPQNVTFYYGCNSAASALLVAASVINGTYETCSNGDTVSFLTETQVSNLPPTTLDPITSGACKASVLVPVSAAAAAKLDNNETSTIQTAIHGGFDLNVQNEAAIANDCTICVESGGVCGQDTTTGDFRCYCATVTTGINLYWSRCTISKSSSLNSFWIAHRHFGRSFWSHPCCCMYHIIHIHITDQTETKNDHSLQKNEGSELDIEAFIQAYGSIAPKRYSYPDVVNMTNSFEDQIGKGGYGTVYKGSLPDGSLVAVKVLSELKVTEKNLSMKLLALVEHLMSM